MRKKSSQQLPIQPIISKNRDFGNSQGLINLIRESLQKIHLVKSILTAAHNTQL